ncbi:MAG: bifunctional precorrin-2 dehydrogenase/sirohydrochlorin ferrochelatase [Acidimicrobiales bacterium]
MPVDAPLYPVNLVLRGRRVLVVGGGRVAAQKVAGLLECEAHEHVVAAEVGPEVRALSDGLDPDGPGRLDLEERPFAPGDTAGHRLVVTATGVPDVDGEVFAECEAAAIWCNSADDPAHCSCTLPSRVRRGPLLATFSTGGRSPAVATWLRRRFGEELGPEYVTLVDLLAEQREAIRAEGRSTEGLDWQRALDSGMLEMIREGRLAEAKERLEACLSSSSD